MSATNTHPASTAAADCAPSAPGITLKDILWQMNEDILTKEVQTSPTYSYQWMADQCGHAWVGMIIVALLWWMFGPFGAWLGFLGAIALIVYVESGDLKEAYAGIAHSIFSTTLDKKNLTADAGIAVFYVVWGAVYMIAAIKLGGLSWIDAFLLSMAWLVIAVVPFYVFLPTRMNWEYASLPFLYRLPDFPTDQGLTPEDATYIDQLVAQAGTSVKHLAIQGALGAGKSSLAVGIGTEGAFAGAKVRYTTFDKLLEMVQAGREPPPPANTKVWPWKQSQILVVDDVGGLSAGPGRGVLKDFEAQLAFLKDKTGDCLGRRSTVWCLSPDLAEAPAYAAALEAFLGGSFRAVSLEPSAAPRKSRRGVVGRVRHALGGA